jgi:Tfp pilus assembly protein PilP
MRRATPIGLILAALGLSLAAAPLRSEQASKAAPASKQPGKQAKAPAKVAPAAEQTPPVPRRDPFDPLVSRQTGPGTNRMPDPGIPGPGGLVVATVRIDGVVRTSSGMIAVMTNPQNRTYFVREGTRIYDGTVERISLDGVTFRERGKDPFGQVVERQVTKRIYPRAGEQ